MIFSAGSVELEIEASKPSSERSPVVVLAHPHPKFGGDMHNKVIDQIFRRSKDRGWGAVRFNFRGVGKSTGAFDQGVGETEDLVSAIQWAAKEFERPTRQITLVGYSFGSWVSTRAAAGHTEIKHLILIAPPLSLQDFNILNDVKLSKSVFAAERDEFSSSEALHQWFSSLPTPKSLQVISESDHFFVGKTNELVRAVVRKIEEN